MATKKQKKTRQISDGVRQNLWRLNIDVQDNATEESLLNALNDRFHLEMPDEMDMALEALTAQLIEEHLKELTIIQGVVFPPDGNLAARAGVEIEAYSDAALENRIGRAVTDKQGHFVLEQAQPSDSDPTHVWFKWEIADQMYRTPYFTPWQVGTPLILLAYQIEVPPLVVIEDSVALEGRLSLESGDSAKQYTVCLIERRQQTGKLLAEAKPEADGTYQLNVNPKEFFDKTNPEIWFWYIVFRSKNEPLIANQDPMLVVPLFPEQSAKQWVKDTVVQEAFEVLNELPYVDQMSSDELDFVLTRRNMSASALRMLKKASALARKTGVDVRAALAFETSGDEVSIGEAVDAAIGGGLIGNKQPELRHKEYLQTILAEHQDRELRGKADSLVPLQNYLGTLINKEEEQLEVVDLWLKSRFVSDEDGFESKLEKKLKKTKTVSARIQFALQIADRIDRDAHFLSVILSHLKRKKPVRAVEWDATKWQKIIEENEVDIPQQFQTDDEPIVAFAGYLKHTMEHLYPSQAVCVHLKNAETTSYGDWKDKIIKLLTETSIHPLDPIVKLERLYPDLNDKYRDIINDPNTQEGFARFQRLYHLTESADSVLDLIEIYDSAADIAREDSQFFVERFTSTFKPNGVDPKQVHNHAQRVSALAKVVYSNLSTEFNDTPVKVLSPVNSLRIMAGKDRDRYLALLAMEMSRVLERKAHEKHDTQASACIEPAEDSILPDWREIFGSEDLGFCECAQCKSIFGPAAYLFDMLLFLDRFRVGRVTMGPEIDFSPALKFLNLVEDADEIVHCVPDDRDYGIGTERAHGVLASQARAIIETRTRLDGSKFNDLQQVLAIDDKDLDGEAKGIGKDTLHDIIHASWGAVGQLAAESALRFMNISSAAHMNQEIKDDPEFSSGGPLARGLTDAVAEKIVRIRDGLPGKKFDSLSQIESKVFGVGPDTLHDIFYTFYSREFEKLYSTDTLLDRFERRRPDVPALLLSCDNTNNEVPHIDLVNELLSDLVESQCCFGMLSAARSMEVRNTEGTSEERAAWPQYPPSDGTLRRLHEATRPWTLPYDYYRDQSMQARRGLVEDDCEELIGKLWTYWALEELGPLGFDENSKALAHHILDLTQPELELVTTEKLVPKIIWGAEVAAAVSNDKSPSVAAIQRSAQLSYFTLEDVLETVFLNEVKSDLSIRLPKTSANGGEPQDLLTCDPERLRLNTDDPKELIKILDRIHRFERLRRKVGWTANQLDYALIALNDQLDKDTIHIIGLLLYLQRRLELDPDEVLALFVKPNAKKPHTLRKDKKVWSAWERLFGTEPIKLPMYSSDDDEDTPKTLIFANISQLVGIGQDEVQFILSKFFKYDDVQTVEDFINFFDRNQNYDEKERIHVWRLAVATVFRVSTFASAIDLSLKEFMALIQFSGIQPLAQSPIEESLGLDSLQNTIQFMELAHQSENCPLSLEEVLYLVGDASLIEKYAPESDVSGHLLRKIQVELARNIEANLNNEVLDAAIIAILADAFSLSVESAQLLLMQLLKNENGDPLLRDFCQEDSILLPFTVSGIKATFTDLVSDDQVEVEPSSLLFDWNSMSPPDTFDKQNYRVQLDISDARQFIEVDGAIRQLVFDTTGDLAVELRLQHEAADPQPIDIGDDGLWDIAKVREFFDQNNVVGQAVTLTIIVEWRNSAGEKTLNVLARNSGRATTQRLNNSLIEAIYTDGVSQKQVRRIEPSLKFDWIANSPPDGINPQHFSVDLMVRDVREVIDLNTGIEKLYFASTGTMTASLELASDPTVSEPLFEEDGDESLLAIPWDVNKVKHFLDQHHEEINLRIRFSIAPQAGQAASSIPPVLRVLVDGDDGKMPFNNSRLVTQLIRLDKAARLMEAMELPNSIWLSSSENVTPMLVAEPDHDNATAAWNELIAFYSLWQRSSESDGSSTFEALSGGASSSHDVLASALGLTREEFEALVQYLQSSGDAVAEISGQQLNAILELSDLARKFALPLEAMMTWVSAEPTQVYQWVLGALRASRPQDQWFEVLKTIHDPVRENLRDAMISWLLTHPRRGELGDKLPPFRMPEYISDYLLTDVQMSACMMTSRVQFAYAAVQRYIDGIRLGSEKGFGPETAESQERFEREWEWRRFYRLWEANRRVFVHPENWLEPDLRPDKSVFFSELEEELLRGPLTTDSAEDTLINYLSKVVDVARPEIVGVVHEEDLPDGTSPVGFRDSELQGTHVFARSRTQPHQLYYRRRLPGLDGRWLPWERIEAELPGTHFVPFIANRRLYLVVAEFGVGRARPEPCDCEGDSNFQDPRRDGHIILSTIERRYGRWSDVHRSEPITFDSHKIAFSDPVFSPPDLDFPYKEFTDARRYGKIAKIEWKFNIVEDGLDPGTECKLIIVKRGDNDERILNDPESDSEWKGDKHGTWALTLDHFPSDISSVRLEIEDPNGGDDDAKFKDIEFTFITEPVFEDDSYTTRSEHDYPPIEREDQVMLSPDGEEPEGPDIVLPGAQKYVEFSINYEDKVAEFQKPELSWFDVRVSEASTPPPEIFSIFVEAPEEGRLDPIKIHVRINDGVDICREIRRQFEFRGTNGQLTGFETDWPDGRVEGSQRICVEQISEGAYMAYIEMFPDGTITSPLETGEYPPGFREPERGYYRGTTPWQQFFHGSGKNMFVPFDWHYLRRDYNYLAVPRSFQLCVPSQKPVAIPVAPKFLDERSDSSEGHTLIFGPDRWFAPNWPVRLPRPHTFWHPQAATFLNLLQSSGIPELLKNSTQTLENPSLEPLKTKVGFFAQYDPCGLVPEQYHPHADVDFTPTGSYADYNWELFFHAPLLIAQRLSEAGQFEAADRWFKLLFDPSQGRLGNNPLESFQTRPLRNAINERVEDMLNALQSNEVRSKFKEQVDRLNRSPYQPHIIARSRLSAYQKMLLMKYLDHLMAWADELFRRAYATDNRTELENASSRYDLVAKLLGERPEIVPLMAEREDLSYRKITGRRPFDSDGIVFWNPSIKRLENYLLPGINSGDLSIIDPQEILETLSNDGQGIPDLLYFCIPHNEKLLEYWDTLADRLGNLRHCRDIEGIQRTLSLYGRRIDPGLLVRATALGIDIDVVLGYMGLPAPKFRFRVLIQRAKEAASRAQSFGQALLGAIEKGDAEELARLRSQNELALLKDAKRVRSEQVREAKEAIEALWTSRESAEIRYAYYSSREKISAEEGKEGELLNKAAKSDQRASSLSAIAAIMGLLPNASISLSANRQEPTVPPSPNMWAAARVDVTAEFGGRTLANIWQQKASGATYEAGQYRSDASKLARQSQFNRRWEDWRLQRDLAESDIEHIDRQIASAEIRLRITEIEQENHQLQVDQAETIDAYMRDKFTNAKLYRWLETRMSRLYYQQYRLAYELALKAHFAMRYEHGLDTDSADALLPDTWDASHRGMGAAEDLIHELEKMESTYLDLWQLQHEKQKTFSLARRWPTAFLKLLQTGECVIDINEIDLDEDEPGDYFRRIKQVSVNIPCVRGPETSVNARLTIIRSIYRVKPGRDKNQPLKATENRDDSSRFRTSIDGSTHIVTSTGINDTGQFDANLNGENLLPFEGHGVTSQWRIQLPHDTNQFDLSTVSDVKIQMLYTSRASDSYRSIAIKTVADRFGEPFEVMIPLSSQFSTEWAKFANGAADAEKVLNIGSIKLEHLPFSLQGKKGLKVDALFYFDMGIQDKPTLSARSGGVFKESDEIGWRPNRTVIVELKQAIELGAAQPQPIELVLSDDSQLPCTGWLILSGPK